MEVRRLESVPEHQAITEDKEKIVTKAQPLTASSQISLWLMRASTQDIYQELGSVSRDSLRNMLWSRGDSVAAGPADVLRKCETEVRFRIESEEEDGEGTESPASHNKSNKKKKSKMKARSSKNQSNDSLMKHFSVKGMV